MASTTSWVAVWSTVLVKIDWDKAFGVACGILVFVLGLSATLFFVVAFFAATLDMIRSM